MIHHAWTAICQHSSIDKDTNNISFNVFEQLTIRIPPFSPDTPGIIFPAQIEIISLWYRDKNSAGMKGKGRVRIEAPHQKEVRMIDIDIDLVAYHRHRTRVRLDGLPIPKDVSGYFYFIMSLETDHQWVDVARIPLEVNVEHTLP
ncbi:MAG: hypothetical protein HY543_11915 [Deltaproteobacteria bacterium]|nr:hypothetical protein [Deltaproteobacteria bacterium]